PQQPASDDRLSKTERHVSVRTSVAPAVSGRTERGSARIFHSEKSDVPALQVLTKLLAPQPQASPLVRVDLARVARGVGVSEHPRAIATNSDEGQRQLARAEIDACNQHLVASVFQRSISKRALLAMESRW